MSELQHTAAEHGPENPTVAFERKDVSVKGIGWFLVGLAVLFVATFLAVWGVFARFDAVENRQKRSVFPVAEAARAAARESDPAGPLPPAPRLEGVVKLPPDQSAGRVFPPSAVEQHDVAPNRPGAAVWLYDEQEKVLDSWGWLDGEHKVAHIPITEAMTRLAKNPGDFLKARPGSKPPNPESGRQRPATDSGPSTDGRPK